MSVFVPEALAELMLRRGHDNGVIRPDVLHIAEQCALEPGVVVALFNRLRAQRWRVAPASSAGPPRPPTAGHGGPSPAGPAEPHAGTAAEYRAHLRPGGGAVCAVPDSGQRSLGVGPVPFRQRSPRRCSACGSVFPGHTCGAPARGALRDARGDR